MLRTAFTLAVALAALGVALAHAASDSSFFRSLTAPLRAPAAGAPPAAPPALAPMAALRPVAAAGSPPLAPVLAHGDRSRPEVALTFDADMTPGMLLRLRAGAVRSWYDRSITTYLRRTRTPATFFVTGLWARTYRDQLRTLTRSRLFEIENHSYEHYAFSEPCWGLPPVGSPARGSADVLHARAALTAAGVPRPRFFRFPGGCYSADQLRAVEALGEQPVAWDVVSNDAFQRDPAKVTRSVLTGVRGGSIVVMHLSGAPNAPATAAALRKIVPALHRRALRCVTLRELLG